MNWTNGPKTNFVKHRWGFLITPNLSWFDSLAYDLNLDVTIITSHFDGQSDQYLWTSAHLNDLDDLQAVADRAAALKALFDGALFVSEGSRFVPFPLRDLYELETEQIQSRMSGDVLASPFSPEYLNTKVDSLLDPTHHFVEKVLFQSRFDDVSRNILSFLGVNGVTWISLYAVLDMLRYNSWTESEISRRKLGTKSDLDRFRQTANNAAAIGPFARHGEQGWQAPAVRMSLNDASELLLPVVAAFLNERANFINVKEKWAALIL